VEDSTRNDDTILRFNAPGSNLAVVLEDDGKVAYAYLLEDEAVVSDVWLYNVAEAPALVDWNDPDGPPFLNPREFCRDEQIPRLGQSSAVRCTWLDRSVEIVIDGVLVARLQPGTKPGWSRLAARPGPLAQPL
jgi:hypothetical protein